MYMATSDNGGQSDLPIATQANTEAQVFSSVVAQVAEHGTGVPQKLPQNSLLLVIYREDSIDKMAIMGGTSFQTNQMVITMKKRCTCSGQIAADNESLAQLIIDVHKGKEDVNPTNLLALLRWLTAHNLIRPAFVPRAG